MIFMLSNTSIHFAKFYTYIHTTHLKIIELLNTFVLIATFCCFGDIYDIYRRFAPLLIIICICCNITNMMKYHGPPLYLFVTFTTLEFYNEHLEFKTKFMYHMCECNFIVITRKHHHIPASLCRWRHP